MVKGFSPSQFPALNRGGLTVEPVQAGARQPNIQTITHGKLTWVNIERPTETEIEYLRQNYEFHPLDLDDCLSRIQRPKIDEYDNYLFIVLHFPVYNRRVRVTVPSEIDIFIGDGYLITLHDGDLRPLSKAFKECLIDEKVRQEMMGRSSGYLLYQLVDRLVDYCFPILNKIAANIEAVEDDIFSEEARETVREISILRRDIISFRRIIKPQIAIIASLEHKERPFLQEDLDVYWGNISDHVAKMWDILEDHRDVVDGLAATNDSLTSYKMNEVIKVLTVISTIMLPLAVISGVYGMNIEGLPFAHSDYAFLVSVAFMLATIAVMLGFFRLRRLI